MEKPRDEPEGPRRRLRDQILKGREAINPALAQHALTNQLLLVDDDLEQAASTIAEIEAFLGRAHHLLSAPTLGRRELSQLADRADTLDALDTLSEAIQSLRRRLSVVAQSLE